jgi:hypothetical protein
MLFWTVQTIIISIIFIFLVHHLITYFKQILTVPRTKDLVNSPIQKYNDMFKIISNSDTSSSSPTINVSDYLPKQSEQSFIPQQESVPLTTETKTSMKNELKSFLKKQLNTNTTQSLGNNTTDISTLDIMDKSSASPFYAAY